MPPFAPESPARPACPAVAYLSDVEGLWSKIESFCARSPLVRLDEGRIRVADGAVFVFGGDAIDRGPEGRRVVRALLEAKEAQGARVVLLAGNRDVNKMRLLRELQGHPHPRAPAEVVRAGKGALLSWIFSNTMGARKALTMRAEELESEGRGTRNEDEVAESFLEDLSPGGEMSRYLARCQLAFRAGPTLFVHGAVTDENFGAVPAPGWERTGDVDAWIAGLNAWYGAQAEAFASCLWLGPEPPPYTPIVLYQAPVPGTRENDGSVIYARPGGASGLPRIPSPALVRRLEASGIRRVVLGHSPSGDAPTFLRAGGFELVLADNSYAPCEEAANVVLIREGGQRLEGSATAEIEGRREPVAFETDLDDRSAPIGKVDSDTGCLVKGRLEGDRYLLWRAAPGYERIQMAKGTSELARGGLEDPR